MTAHRDIVDRLFTSPAWMRGAPCAGLGHLFYVNPREPGSSDAVNAAKAICAGCDRSTQCLEYAIDNHEEHGIWAGRNRTELQAIRKRRREMGWETGRNRRRARHGTRSGVDEHRKRGEELCRDCQWVERDMTSPFETTSDRRARLRREAS